MAVAREREPVGAANRRDVKVFPLSSGMARAANDEFAGWRSLTRLKAAGLPAK